MLAISIIALVLGSLEFPVSSGRSLAGSSVPRYVNSLSAPALSPRQGPTLPTVPPQCRTTCNPINTIIQNQCTPQQCCLESFVRGWYNCGICVGQALDFAAADWSDFQEVLNALHNECEARGFDVPNLTFPGQGGSTGSPPPSPRPSTTRTALSSSTSVRPSSTPTIGSSTPPPLPSPPPPITQQTITTPSSPTNTAAPASTTSTSSSNQLKASWLTLFAVNLILMLGPRV